MSGESGLHVRLVQAAAAEIWRQHRHLYSLVMLIDLPEFGRNRPSRIGGYVPDIFAIDTPETCRIIGEAKTPLDLETERSKRQILAFLRHLSVFHNSAFYISVPWPYRFRAQALVSAAAQTVQASSVAIQIVAGE